MTGTSTKLTDRIQAQALKIITGTGTTDHEQGIKKKFSLLFER
jgi:hypothetical protein